MPSRKPPPARRGYKVHKIKGKCGDCYYFRPRKDGNHGDCVEVRPSMGTIAGYHCSDFKAKEPQK